MTTIVMRSFGLRGAVVTGGGGGRSGIVDFGLSTSCGSSGRKLEATTALGMTETIKGSSDALSTVFSLLRRVNSAFLHYRQDSPSMTDTYHVVNIAKDELQ